MDMGLLRCQIEEEFKKDYTHDKKKNAVENKIQKMSKSLGTFLFLFLNPST